MKLHLDKTARLSCPILLAKQQIKDFGETTNDSCVIIICISAAAFVKGEDFADVALHYLKIIIITPQKRLWCHHSDAGGNAAASSPAPGLQEKQKPSLC